MNAPRALILQPRTVPVVGVDRHLPPVPAERLQAEALRARFAGSLPDGPPGFEPEFGGDGPRLAERTPRAAAVLVPLVMRPQGLQVLLTRRAEHLNQHAGQISFPGGRVDPEDADATDAALREAREEIGLPSTAVEVIGRLPVYGTVTAYEVTPVVGLVEPPFTLALQADEVAACFEVPLAFLMDPANHRHHAFHAEGLQRRFLSMPWTAPDPDAPGAPPREHFIWGATAAMLRNLYAFLSR